MSEKLEFDKDKNTEFRVTCNYCDGDTVHKVLSSVSLSAQEDLGRGDFINYWGNYQIIQCQGCRAISFRKTSGDDQSWDLDEDGEPFENPELFPGRLRGRKPLKNAWHLPKDIRGIYDETHRALCDKIKTLSAIGIRALVESVCKNKGADGKNLEDKINALVPLGILTKEGADVLHGTRFLGNQAAHELAEPTEEELDTAMDVVENLLFTVYVLPEKAKKLPKK
jgi:hypothetical protein